MTLAEAAAATPMKRAGGTCSVGMLLERLDDDDRKMLSGWLTSDQREIPNSWIADVLRKEGHRLHRDTLNRHRNRSAGSGCKCP